MTESIQKLNARDAAQFIAYTINNDHPSWLHQDQAVYIPVAFQSGISIAVSMTLPPHIASQSLTLRYRYMRILANRPDEKMDAEEIKAFAREVHENGKKFKAEYQKYVSDVTEIVSAIESHYPVLIQFENEVPETLHINNIMPPGLVHLNADGSPPPLTGYIKALIQNKECITFHVDKDACGNYDNEEQTEYFKNTILPILTANIPENEFDKRIRFTSDRPSPAMRLRDEAKYLYVKMELEADQK